MLPEPYYDRDGITIYNADCREIFPLLEPESIDLLLTDPPYGISYVSNSVQDGGRPIAGDDSLNTLADALPLVNRLLRHDRHAYVFAAPSRIGEAADLISDYMKVKNIIVWDKGNAGTKGDLIAGYGYNWEAVVYANKGRRPLNGPRPRTIFRYDWQATRDKSHPTSKPVSLMSWLMFKSSNPGELVIDPFMGSGPVLRAAKDLGRRAIGIEIDEGYCEAAVLRLVASGTVIR